MHTSKQANKARGYIIWEGASMLDGAPIMAVMTMHSANVKTGDMVQTWIIRADMAPMAALDAQADASICGDCPHRRSMGGACYVDVSRAPSAVYKGVQRGIYPRIDAETAALLVEGRMVRLGAYGDPAAVPAQVWRTLVERAEGHTGYTHQWRARWAASAGEHDAILRDLCMASADSAEQAHEARSAGWRTFRVQVDGEQRMAREAVCPASEEAGHKVQCSDCRACNGAGTGRKGSIVINVHGSLSGRFIRSRNQSAVVEQSA